jgi:hypothetical protein
LFSADGRNHSRRRRHLAATSADQALTAGVHAPASHDAEFPDTPSPCAFTHSTNCLHLLWKHLPIADSPRRSALALRRPQPLPEYRHCHSQRAPTKVYERPPPQQPTISLHTTPPAHSFGPSPDQSALARPIFSRLLTPTAPSAAPSAPPPPLPTVRPRAAVPAAASLSAARAHRRSASTRLAHALPRRNCVSPLAEPASPAGLRPHPLQEASRQDGTGAHR